MDTIYGRPALARSLGIAPITLDWHLANLGCPSADLQQADNGIYYWSPKAAKEVHDYFKEYWKSREKAGATGKKGGKRSNSIGPLRTECPGGEWTISSAMLGRALGVDLYPLLYRNDCPKPDVVVGQKPKYSKGQAQAVSNWLKTKHIAPKVKPTLKEIGLE